MKRTISLPACLSLLIVLTRVGGDEHTHLVSSFRLLTFRDRAPSAFISIETLLHFISNDNSIPYIYNISMKIMKKLCCGQTLSVLTTIAKKHTCISRCPSVAVLKNPSVTTTKPWARPCRVLNWNPAAFPSTSKVNIAAINRVVNISSER